MTQNQIILNWLKGKRKLTPLDAMQKWGVARLASRIFELRQQGHKIKAETVQVYNRFGGRCSVAQYSMSK